MALSLPAHARRAVQRSVLLGMQEYGAAWGSWMRKPRACGRAERLAITEPTLWLSLRNSVYSLVVSLCAQVASRRLLRG